MLNITHRLAWTQAAVLACGINAAGATVYPSPDNSRFIGENTTHTVIQGGGSLEAITENTKSACWRCWKPIRAPIPGSPGRARYTIPSQMLLPDTPRKGIVINLAELRLYYYPKGQNQVIVYPIGIGQLGRNTPMMGTVD